MTDRHSGGAYPDAVTTEADGVRADGDGPGAPGGPHAPDADGPAPGGRPPRGGFEVGLLHPQTAALLVAVFSAVLLGSVMMLLPVPYAAVVAGPTANTLSDHDGAPLIAIADQQTYPTDGALDLTTVRIFGGPRSRVTPWQMVTGWLDPDEQVVPSRLLFPPQQTAEQEAEENRVLMVGSQQSATVAALRSLGYTVGEEVRVAGFTPDSPSEGTLEQGDVVLSVSGVPTPDGDTLRTELQKVTAGEPAPMVVERDGSARPVSPPTRRSSAGATVLGVLVEPVYTYPFPVTIKIEDVGGSSAGTMFALGIVDKLTPGSLTGGRTVAGTGEIDADGNVGPIGFIQQKMIGAKRDGATVFLAPRENCDEVVGHVPEGLSVVAVSTLTQARDALQQISEGGGEQDLPRCG